MDKFVEISLLFDFYSDFLTDKQKLTIDYYYNLNYSLAEIGEEMGISRQGVRDMLVRSEETLYNFDRKLSLLDKYVKKQEMLKTCISKLVIAAEKSSDDSAALIKEVVDILEKSLDD
ncbi:MAG: hypothetical protein HGA49_07105 [Eubacteriaceae bacterium]|nr:hypothetical protein [Eubacteriaceae bacterium]